ncbi:MAG TPA: ZIP family metal transporter [Candidatus Xenobia bacterium]|nr:ZIP family metal transporter [Candidatus Xenobia bacterium]
MQNLQVSFLLGLTAAAANVFGGFMIVRQYWRREALKYFIALGSGFMLATSLLEMVPEGIELTGSAGLTFVLGGYLLVHFFEHTMAAHLHFGEETHPEEFERPARGYAAALGMAIHAFFDGAAIAAGFIVSTKLGLLVFLAIFLHKIPDGFTIASVMLASGRGPRAALAASVLMGATTLLGLATMWILQMHVAFGLLLSAGATLYVAASDLMPEVNREPGIGMAVWVFAGVALMLLFGQLLPL